MNNVFERSIGLLGKDNFERIKDYRIAIFGLGGVGGTATESFVRSGFSNLLILDFDVIDDSNINRQILYTQEDIGKLKTEVAEKRLKAINPELKLKVISAKVDANISLLLEEEKIDFIVDAIDDVYGKVELIKFALSKDIPIIVSLGMANRFDPTKVIVTRLDKTTDDPLAKKLRYTIRKQGLETSRINCVVSKELPIKDSNKLHSMMNVPSSAGLTISYFVIQYFLNN